MKFWQTKKAEMQVRLDWLDARLYPHRKCLLISAVTMLVLFSSFLAVTRYSQWRDDHLREGENQEKAEQALTAFSKSLTPLYNDMYPVPVIIRSEKDFEFPNKDILAVFCPALYKTNPIKEDVIIVRKEYYQRAKFSNLLEVLKHELIHAWLSWLDLRTPDDPYHGHGLLFIEKGIALDLEEFGDAVPQEVIKAKKADIKQHGYQFLPQAEELAKHIPIVLHILEEDPGLKDPVSKAKNAEFIKLTDDLKKSIKDAQAGMQTGKP